MLIAEKVPKERRHHAEERGHEIHPKRRGGTDRLRERGRTDIQCPTDRRNEIKGGHLARAGLLGQSGDVDAAEAAYARAIGLEADPAVRRFLQQRCARLRA